MSARPRMPNDHRDSGSIAREKRRKHGKIAGRDLRAKSLYDPFIDSAAVIPALQHEAICFADEIVLQLRLVSHRVDRCQKVPGEKLGQCVLRPISQGHRGDESQRLPPYRPDCEADEPETPGVECRPTPRLIAENVPDRLLFVTRVAGSGGGREERDQTLLLTSAQSEPTQNTVDPAGDCSAGRGEIGFHLLNLARSVTWAQG